MATDTTSPQGRRKSSVFASIPGFTGRRKSPSGAESRPKSQGLLVPQPTTISTTSSSSDQSQSVGSDVSRSRSPIRRLVSKRSSSKVSSLPKGLQESDFEQFYDWFHGFDNYNQLVTTHISRDRAYASQEFTSVCKILTKNCGGKFIYGMPEAVFDLALLWCPSTDSSWNSDSTIPSWSWASFKGPVNFPFDPTNCPEHYRLPAKDPENNKLFRSEVRNYYIGPKTFSERYELRREKKNEKIRMIMVPWAHAEIGREPGEDSNVLHFTASTISAHEFDFLQRTHNGKEIPCSHILNSKNQHCGNIMEFKKNFAEDQCEQNVSFELVLLSRNRRVKRATDFKRPEKATLHPPQTPIWDGDKFLQDQEEEDFDSSKFEDGTWKVLNVMMICWTEDRSFAGRVSVGRIHEDEWLKHNPKVKDIILL